MPRNQKRKYIFENKNGDLLELWPADSSEVYLSQPYLPKKLLKHENVRAPAPLPFDILGSYGILNAARTVHDKNYYCNYSNKSFASILITTGGEADVRINERKFGLKNGSAFISNAGTETRITVKKNWSVMWFHLDESWHMDGRNAVLLENADTAEILHCADVCIDEVFKPRRDLHLLDVCAQMLVLRLRRLLGTDGDAGEKFAELAESIRLDPSRKCSVKSAAQTLGISPYELDKFSVRAFGEKFRKAVFGIRMEAARRLLGEKIPLEKVAKSVGFSDQAAFSKAFKRFHKIPPSRFAE